MMQRVVCLLASLCMPLRGASAFQRRALFPASRSSLAMNFWGPGGGRSGGYVPDGLTEAQYAALKTREAAQRSKKDFGRGGSRGFESRSMASFVKALEAGEAKHLMPVNPSHVAAGKIALKDVPYMQRGGSWDNSDLGAKKGWQKSGFGMRAFNDGRAQKMKANESLSSPASLAASVSEESELIRTGTIRSTTKGARPTTSSAAVTRGGPKALRPRAASGSSSRGTRRCGATLNPFSTT